MAIKPVSPSVPRPAPPHATAFASFDRLLEKGVVTRGTRLANGWEQTFFEAGPTQGALVFVLHGFPGSPAFAARMLPKLVEAGYHVVMPELRWLTPAQADGHAPAGAGERRYGLDALARDVECLASTFSSGPMRLVTHDFGSLIAYQINPTKIASLVTMSIPHPAGTLPTHARLSTVVSARHFASIPLHRDPAFVRDNLDAWVERWGAGFQPDLAEFRARLEDPAVVDAVRQLYTDYNVNAALNTPKQALGLESTLQMYKPSTLTTLAFAGLRDGATALASFDDGKPYERGAYEVRQVDAGHFIAEELEVGPQIVEFLKRTAPQRPGELASSD